MTLTEFLLARIAEDEAEARAASGGPWTWHEYGRKGDDPLPYMTGRGGDPETYAYDTEVIEPDHSGECGCRSACTLELRVRREDRDHIARHDPARVLAECEAKRRIVEKAQRSDAAFSYQINPATTAASFAMTEVLHMLALPYADHPDYRDEWRL